MGEIKIFDIDNKLVDVKTPTDFVKSLGSSVFSDWINGRITIFNIVEQFNHGERDRFKAKVSL